LSIRSTAAFGNEEKEQSLSYHFTTRAPSLLYQSQQMHDESCEHLRRSALSVIVQLRKHHPGALVGIDGQLLPFLQQMKSR
jgi:hypothetical protein